MWQTAFSFSQFHCWNLLQLFSGSFSFSTELTGGPAADPNMKGHSASFKVENLALLL